MRGFSLVELLVVISITAGIAGVLIPQFSKYNQDQALSNTSQAFQSSARTAQNNAISGVKCPSDISASSWSIRFTSNSNYELLSTCSDSVTPVVVDSFRLSSGTAVSLVSVNDTYTSNDPTGATISYKNISGDITLSCPIDIAPTCIGSLKKMKIKFQSLMGSGKATEIVIEKGGSTYRSSDATTPELLADILPTPTSAPLPPTPTTVAGATSTPIPPTPTSGPTPTTDPVAPTPTSTPLTSPTGNLALNRPSFASTTENGTYIASNAVDGNTSTRWSSSYSDPQSIYMDLGNNYILGQVILRWEAANGKNYTIDTSIDGATWNTVSTVVNGDGDVDTINFTGSGRYIRMYGTARGTFYGYSLYEFEVYGTAGASTPTPTITAPTATPTPIPPTPTPPASNLALNRPVSASTTENGANIASNAVDGNASTRWSSTYSDAQWIYVDLGGSYNFSRVVLNWEAAYGRDYRIQTSNDAVTWVTIYTRTNGTGGNEILNVSGSGRYVKMDGVTRGTVYGYSLYEFEVW